ncbi:MAG: paraquat-inducible protein A [Pseudomonadota bacterium]
MTIYGTRIGAIEAVNLALLVAYPAAWFSPLATTGMVSWWSGEKITIARAVQDLLNVDIALAILVALFAIIVPFGKTVALSLVHFKRLGPDPLPLIEGIGKLSMADVFLIALYIVVVKGVGIGHVETAWGLWLFTLCVLASIWVGWATAKRLKA